MSTSPVTESGLLFFDILQRLKELEAKVLRKNKRVETTRAQQMLLLKHLGIITPILELNIEKQEKAKLLSALLNADETNLEDDLSNILNDNPRLRNIKDIKFLIATFNKCGLPEKKKEIEEIYREVLTK